MAKKELTQKQINFCHQYVIDFNATQAAKRAGYSKRTAHSIGHENLKKPEIAEFINKLSGTSLNSLGINKQRIIQELAKIAFNKETSDPSRIKSLQILLENVSDGNNENRNEGSQATRVLNAIQKYL